MTGPGDYLARGLWCAASVGWSLPTAAARWPDRVALAIAATGRATEHYTFAALHGRVQAVAADLADRGVRSGDRVVAQLPNRIELMVVILAAWQLGAVAVPVLPMYRGRELAHILRVTRPAALVAATARGERRPAHELTAVLADLGHNPAARYAVGAEVDGWLPLPTPLPASRGFCQGESRILSAAGSTSTTDPARDQSGPNQPAPSWPAPDQPAPDQPAPDQPAPHWPAGPDECCLLLFTSGTTSEPKGVRHSSRSLLAEARSYRDEALLGAEQPVLVPAPVPHIGAVVACTLLPCLTAAPTVLLESWDVEVAARACAEEKVALAIGAPVFLAELLDRYEREPDGHRISMFHTGAAPTGDSVVVRAQQLGVTAWRAWGMTEAPTLTSGHPGDPLDRRTRTDGRIDVGSEVQAVDEHRAPLPAGTPGELRIRSPKLMLGYLDPAHQAVAVDAEGWFYTGDIGAVDADGWVTIQGRLKDIINRGGEKFSAAEIESLVGEHPDIEAVAVVGLPDPRLGERVGAFVTLRPGRSWPGEAVLLAHLELHQLARQKYPVVWQVLDHLPRTPTGKIQKRQLLADWHPDRP